MAFGIYNANTIQENWVHPRFLGAEEFEKSRNIPVMVLFRPHQQPIRLSQVSKSEFSFNQIQIAFIFRQIVKLRDNFCHFPSHCRLKIAQIRNLILYNHWLSPKLCRIFRHHLRHDK